MDTTNHRASVPTLCLNCTRGNVPRQFQKTARARERGAVTIRLGGGHSAMNEQDIRVRAYFHFENRTGRAWADPISNWVQAEEEERAIPFEARNTLVRMGDGLAAREPAEKFWKELGRRVRFIRDLYRIHKISLKSGQGLAIALDEAEMLASGDVIDKSFSREKLVRTVNDAHVIYTMAESLETCVKAGLDVRQHLAQLTTGTADYGTPARPNVNSMFLKDFEYELFIASALIRRRLIPSFSKKANDPLGDLVVDRMIVEAKHPNSVGQLEKLLRKFNSALHGDKLFGVFAVALEDAHNLGDHAEFTSRIDYQRWLEAKRDGMEAIGLQLVKRAAALGRIAVMVQTQSVVEIIEGETTMRRLSNSILFDHRPTFCEYETTARLIAEVFNPEPALYSHLAG
jgi:hypothetical protein